jgi:hypothetical protein
VDKPDELLAGILGVAAPPPLPKKVKIKSYEKHANFTHELQSAPRLTVVFSKIYFER